MTAGMVLQSNDACCICVSVNFTGLDALFAIVAAVVTDAGSLLSHPAIAAREDAIPCVAGTLDGTRRIPDGALVTVDGSAGIVLIEA